MSEIKVFLSHKHEFKDSAKRLQWYLGRLAPDRFDFFASSTDIGPGEDWRKRLEAELAKADWLIALTTQCGNKSKEWIVSEISSFCKINEKALEPDADQPRKKRCIIIHDEGDRLEAFANLQQFSATKDGCEEFLRRLLSSEQGSDGFNRYIGDLPSELKKEAEWLWGILVASPPPYVLLPKATFILTPENAKILDEDEVDDSMGVTLGRMAAAIHDLQLTEDSNRWEGTFGDLRQAMSGEQRAWIPQIAFLLRKVLEQKRIQKAFILYPDYKGETFYVPVANELFVYPSGDMLLEFNYIPLETAFVTRNQSTRDQLFHLITLCIQTQWRLLDRYREEVENLASKEETGIVELSEEDKLKRVDLNKRILIDWKKIHSESQARAITNTERILKMFPESERASVKSDFQVWLEAYQSIEGGGGQLEATKLKGNLDKAEEIIQRLLRKYSNILGTLDVW